MLEKLLAGVPLNPDQSFARNQFDGRFDTPLSEYPPSDYRRLVAKLAWSAKGRLDYCPTWQDPKC